MRPISISGQRSEAGQVTAFVVVFVVALIFLAGLVIDGGYVLAARRRAMNEAQAAARAGAQALDLDAYRGGGTFTLDNGSSPCRSGGAAPRPSRESSGGSCVN